MSKPQAFVIAALIALSLSGCKEDAADPRTNTPVVRIMSVPEAKRVDQAFTGVVVARVESNLGFRVSGKVTERLVDTGQAVKSGQPLMRIDRNDLALAIKAKEESVRAAKARALRAYADEARTEPLVKSGAASQKSYEQAKSDADSAQAELNAAEAEAQIARNEGEYSLLVADADGIIVETLAEPGQVVNAGQAVVKLAHVGPREASVNLPETMRPALDSKAEAVLYGNDTRGTAHLRQLSGSADPQTRTFEARYVLDDDLAQAALGATITIYLQAEQDNSFIEVPLGAVTDEGKGPGVWVVSGTSPTLSFRPVEIAFLTQETAVLKGGISSQDKIVAIGAHLLHEGQKVQLADSKELK